MKLSNKNTEKLESLLREALKSKGYPTIGPVLHEEAVKLLEKNKILLADMMYIGVSSQKVLFR